MPDYIMPEETLQVVQLTNSDGKSEEIVVDTATGEIVPVLRDDKFPWRERKRDTLALSDIYREGQLGRYADRTRGCSTWLEYLATFDGERRQLHHFNACKLRLCPLCSVRRARLMAARLTKVLEKVQADHAGTQYIFLTLTLRNCEGDKLRDTLTLLTYAWSKLTRRRPVDRAVKGWFRAIEITRNRLDNTYHPHIHAILAVEDAYFSRASGLYITQDKWREFWKQSLKVNYLPIVGIQSTKSKDGGEAAAAAAVEAAKYACKATDYISPNLPRAEVVEVAKTYTEALAGKRLTALGGWLLEASRELGLDVEAENDDLVHDEDGNGELTEESAEMLEEYVWRFRVEQHVLRDRKQNPQFIG